MTMSILKQAVMVLLIKKGWKVVLIDKTLM